MLSRTIKASRWFSNKNKVQYVYPDLICKTVKMVTLYASGAVKNSIEYLMERKDYDYAEYMMAG